MDQTEGEGGTADLASRVQRHTPVRRVCQGVPCLARKGTLTITIPLGMSDIEGDSSGGRVGPSATLPGAMEGESVSFDVGMPHPSHDQFPRLLSGQYKPLPPLPTPSIVL